MPGHRYRRIKRATYEKTIVYTQTIQITHPYTDSITLIQTSLFNVVDDITKKIQFDAILREIKTLQMNILTKYDILHLLDIIQTTMSGIMKNITQRENLDMVLERAEYLRSIINAASLPDGLLTDCTVYLPYVRTLMDMLVLIGETPFDYGKIQPHMEVTRSILHENIENDRLIETIEMVILSVVGNITDRVETGIIETRIQYLVDLTRRLEESGRCALYNQYLAAMIFDVIDTITSQKTFNPTDIQTKLADIRLYIDSKLRYSKRIKDIEQLTISILENITNHVDLGLIMTRINYMSELLRMDVDY